MWRRVVWVLPLVAFAATFGVFSVRHPGSVKAILASGQGLLTIGAAAVGLAVVIGGSVRSRTVERIAPFVLTAAVVGAAAYAEVPFERRSTQNRTLVAEPVMPPPDAAAMTAAEPAPAPAPARMAVRHSTGTLRGINHSASGTVSIIESASGGFVVRFENFQIQGAPASVLYVAEGDDVRRPSGTNLGPFTATDGVTLDVALPDGVRPGPGWTVLIWCERFVTPIANATQRLA